MLFAAGCPCLRERHPYKYTRQGETDRQKEGLTRVVLLRACQLCWCQDGSKGERNEGTTARLSSWLSSRSVRPLTFLSAVLNLLFPRPV